MASRIRRAIAPLYLFLCLILGGSAQGIWANMILQLLGVAILAWAALTRHPQPVSRSGKWLWLLIGATLIVITLQFVPLPPALWQSLGGRAPIAEGYEALGLAAPALPISLTPYGGFSSLLSLIPALAILAAMLRLESNQPLWLAMALVGGTLAGVLLGALQVSSADPQLSPWYLYDRTNYGAATGFFANANHMATLLVIALPFLAALLASARGGKKDVQRYSAAFALVVGAAIVVVVGIVINGSLAGFGLAVPAVVASALILLPRQSVAARWTMLVARALLVAAVALLMVRPVSGGGLQSEAAGSVQSREAIFATTAQAAAKFMPTGTGLGSFRSVYALSEDHTLLDPRVVINHAHNDYLEIALELGVAGVLLIVAFLLWWTMAAWKAWTSTESAPYVRAAVIASAVILFHSLVDFPLRTVAIEACFAMCLGFMAAGKPPPPPDRSTLWPTRHVVLD